MMAKDNSRITGLTFHQKRVMYIAQSFPNEHYKPAKEVEAYE